VSAIQIVSGSDVDPMIARVAGRQDGVATRAQLLALGISGKALDHRVKTGRLIAIHRGVYAVGHEALSPHGRIRAALLVAGLNAAASHSTATYLDHLTPTLPAVIHVTTVGSARRSRPGLIVHQTTRPFDRRVIGGLPVTTTLRALEDLGYPDKLVREALARDLVRLEDLPHQVEAAPTQSELERRMRRLCSRAGLPQPVCQLPLGPYVIDFAWTDHRVLVETDDFKTHGRRQAFEDDRAGDADLIAQGYVVLRFTWRQIRHEPMIVAARLAAALALRRAHPDWRSAQSSA
jgi:very-short-patch-repair endonuclease